MGTRLAPPHPTVGTIRRWHIPAPLGQQEEAPGPAGLTILQEFPNELGVVLWKSLRSVLLWAAQDARARAGLFAPEAADRRQAEILAFVPDTPDRLRHSLEDLLPVLAGPERTDREFVAVACSRIGAWAEERSAPRTALEYLQAAAHASPADPKPALTAGRRARDLALYGRAETWIHRAIGLARQKKDWETYVDAYRARGTMMRQRGVLPAARKSYLKALRRARRHEDRERVAMTLHGLFVIEHRAGRVEDALRHAREAIFAYTPSHPRLPHLAHDIAYTWVEQGKAGNALPVFFEMVTKVDRKERPLVLGSIGRAGGALGDTDAFQWAKEQLYRARQETLGLAEAWVDLARGALALARLEEARQAAKMAETVARERGEGQMRFLAEELLDDLHATKHHRKHTSPAEEIGDQSATIARELIRSLQSAPTRCPAGA